MRTTDKVIQKTKIQQKKSMYSYGPILFNDTQKNNLSSSYNVTNTL